MTARDDNTVRAPYPGIKEPHQAASLAVRLGALGYDAMILAAVWFFAAFPLVLFAGTEGITAHKQAFQGYLFAVGALYCVGSWVRGGQTVGMRAWSLTLVDRNGGRVSAAQGLLRYLCAWVSLLSVGLGFLWIVFDAERCTWHDRAAGTRVLRVPRPQRAK